MSDRDVGLRNRAQLLLRRREERSGIGFYIRHHGKRHLVFLVLYLIVAGVLWHYEASHLAVVMATFGLATRLRDFRWWSVLAREWPYTLELIDWDRVARLAEADEAQDG